MGVHAQGRASAMTFGRAVIASALTCLGSILASCGGETTSSARIMGAEGLLTNAILIAESLAYLGTDVSDTDLRTLQNLLADDRPDKDASDAEAILDEYVLVDLSTTNDTELNASLAEAGWTNFLVKVRAPDLTGCRIVVSSPNALPVVHKSAGQEQVLPANVISDEAIAERFLELILYRNEHLDTLLLDEDYQYFILQAYTRAARARTATLQFSYRECEIDLPSRHVTVNFEVTPAVKVIFKVKDDDGSPTTAAFTVTDGINRIIPNPLVDPLPLEYRHRYALRPPWERLWTGKTAINSIAPGQRAIGIYPFPARRIATKDTYPDLYFQAQIYRGDGEHLMLQPGVYNVEFRRGPEYKVSRRMLVVSDDKAVQEETFELERWINLSDDGWYSADLHVHATGCKHHESPGNGLQPEHLWRQARGEDLAVVAVLNWGVGWYDQRKYFDQQRGRPFGSERNIVRYDVEVSEFPSGNLGHLALLGLKDNEYPGTDSISDWPSWTVPILRWAKGQDATTGFLHTGWGMQAVDGSTAVPNYSLPELSGIGANEYVVAVTQDVVDLYGIGDTSPVQELNTWYHSLSSGFRPRIMGESDFPCVYHEKIGIARGYAKLDTPLTFDTYLAQVKAGRSYVSDGLSHIVDFTANSQQMGVGDSEVQISRGESLHISARVAAMLSIKQTPLQKFIGEGGDQRQPSWTVEKARIGNTREVPVELIVNGHVEATTTVMADGDWRDVKFSYTPDKSSWLALRIFPSSHTNPIFVLVDGEPINASRRSTEWMRKVARRLWTVKSDGIRDSEKADARQAYENADEILRIISEQASDED